MALYDGVSGVAREVSKKDDGVSAVAREVAVAYDGVSGVAREYFKSGTPLSSLAVGSTVYMKVNGVSKAFIVVHQGRPSTAYDTSCNGTWLLMKDIYETRAWHSEYYNWYRRSTIHSYLNTTFLNLFESGVINAIKQVKVPHVNNYGSYAMDTENPVSSGSNGLSTRIFLLSFIEVGFNNDDNYYFIEGSVLSYFSGAADSKRAAYLNGSAVNWWLRSPDTTSSSTVALVNPGGYGGAQNANKIGGVRPALVLPSSLLVDDAFNVIAA